MGLGGIHHAVYMRLGTDIAGVDAQAFQTGLQSGNCQAVIKMNVCDKRQ